MPFRKRFVFLQKTSLSMAKIQIKSETRHELSFFPNSFDDYVPKDSKVRMVDRIVRSMDINPLMDTYDGTGASQTYDTPSCLTFNEDPFNVDVTIILIKT